MESAVLYMWAAGRSEGSLLNWTFRSEYLWNKKLIPVSSPQQRRARRAGVIQAQRRHMFLSDGVRFDSHGTQMPLEVDVTTLLDESVEAATICWLPSVTGPVETGRAPRIHCTPHFISPGVGLEILILPFLLPLYMLALSLLMQLSSFKSFIFLSFYKCRMKTGDGTLKSLNGGRCTLWNNLTWLLMKTDRVLRASSLSTGDKISCGSNLETVEYRRVYIESGHRLNPRRSFNILNAHRTHRT